MGTYPYKEKPKEKEPMQNITPNEIAELRNEIAEIKALLAKSSRSSEEKKIIADNMKDWLNGTGDIIKRDILNKLDNEKRAVEALEAKINELKKKIDGTFVFSGFKEFVFWLMCVCNIGYWLYQLYIKIDWSAIIQ